MLKHKLIFETFSDACKYQECIIYHGEMSISCTHEDNIPEGYSWGNCCAKDCPFMKSNK
jgi:hypothetical protein